MDKYGDMFDTNQIGCKSSQHFVRYVFGNPVNYTGLINGNMMNDNVST